MKIKISSQLRALSAVLFSSVLLVGGSAFGQVTWGHEFEFGSPSLKRLPSPMKLYRTIRYSEVTGPGEPEAQAMKAFADEVKKACKRQCKIEPYEGKWGLTEYKVIFKDGYYFGITADSWVVEITGKPQTLDEIKERKDLMQKMIFDIAAKVGLSAYGSDSRFSRSANHMNFGALSAFGSQGGVEFLRFFTDFANEPALARGAFGKDKYNAPAFAELSAEQRAAMMGFIAEINRNPQSRVGPSNIANQILEKIYTDTPNMSRGHHHYHAFSVKQVVDASGDSDRPGEIRSVRMPEKIDDFVSLVELLEARMAFVAKRKGLPIIYVNSDRIDFTPTEIASRFYLYVTESGLDFENYRHLMGPDLENVTPDPFVMGEVDWRNSHFVKAIEGHLDRIAVSPLLQQRLLSALVASNATRSPEAAAAVERILQMLKEPKEKVSKEAKIEIKLFLKKVSEIPQWKKLIPRLRQADPRGELVPSVMSCSAVLGL